MTIWRVVWSYIERYEERETLIKIGRHYGADDVLVEFFDLEDVYPEEVEIISVRRQ